MPGSLFRAVSAIPAALMISAALLAGPATAASAAPAHAAPFALAGKHTSAACGNCAGATQLIIELEALGFTAAEIQVVNGKVAAGGPAPLVGLACTLLGTTLGYGGIGYYDTPNGQGEGLVAFDGDSQPDHLVNELVGSGAVQSIQDCTNEEYALSRTDSSIVDAMVAPGQLVNVAPDALPVDSGPDVFPVS